MNEQSDHIEGKSLSREDFLAFIPKPQKVYVEAFGAYVYVRPMNGLQREKFEAAGRAMAAASNVEPTIRASMISSCCVDANGQRLFSRDDVARINEVDGDALDQIFTFILTASGIEPKQKDATEAEEAERKAFPQTPTDVSFSL